ncbi:hypothetical protein AZE42_11018 [Rhizopogon vesiculosus]|uniref:Glucose-methanol-choline oxidoreductase N-terminal domain-containing protein n=1 Tax=Rhizopogon vesiculosus TaxID=180088 RepID=A0A1J8QEV2_9AGAM|nr:hypothetical protein AZE42_11018 [Rhizopogon vesiculosus]
MDDTNDLETCNAYSVHAPPSLSATINKICLSHGRSTLMGKLEGVLTQPTTTSIIKLTTRTYNSGTVRASKLVVVSAGAFGSLTILERSGIGAEAIIKQCGIKPLVDLPGVGENYQGLLSFIYITIFGLGF